VKHGDRVGQLVLLHAPTFQLREHPIDLQTPRGAAGFGSTGR
jgi:dUTPase